MVGSIDERFDQLEAKVERLEVRFADMLTKLQVLNESTARAVKTIARAAEAAEAMREATAKLSAHKEALGGHHQKH